MKKKTDSEVYNYGRAVGSVATDIVLAFAGATIVDKAMDLLKGSKVGQKIISLANQARNYFNDFTCQNKQVLANTLYDILDDSSDVAKAAAKQENLQRWGCGRRIFERNVWRKTTGLLQNISRAQICGSACWENCS